MSEKYKFVAADGLYFISPTIIGWVDLFTKKQYCEIVLASLTYCQKNKGLIIHAWCIMSSHLHLIVSCEKGNLSAILRDFKTFTNKAFIDELNNGNDSRKEWVLDLFKKESDAIKRVKYYKVWQDGNHPILLDNNNMIDVRLNYLHQNPVEQGIVFNPEDYIYSSARDYCGEKGDLELVLIT